MAFRGRNTQGVEKPYSQTGQKGSRCKAREKPTSGGVLRSTSERGGRAQHRRWAFFNGLQSPGFRSLTYL